MRQRAESLGNISAHFVPAQMDVSETENEIRRFEIVNYVSVLGLMAVVVFVPRWRRRSAAVLTPMPSSTKEQSA